MTDAIAKDLQGALDAIRAGHPNRAVPLIQKALAAHTAKPAIPAKPAVPAPAADPAPAPTADQIWARYLDAADKVLIAQGKPAGREGAERGSLTRDEQIAIVNGLGIPNALAILAAANLDFGPEPAPGYIA